MSSTIKDYHRTFLYYPSRKGPSFAEQLNKLGNPGSPATVHEPFKPQENIRDKYVGVSTMKRTTRYHKALEIVGSTLREITIEEKGDQEFESWATPWEKEWSPLTRNKRNGRYALLPVVDGNAMIVGYSGPVLSSEILIGRPTWLALIYSAEETLKYHQMFIGAKALHTAMPNLDVYGDGLHYYAVMTDIYGEITSFQLAYPSLNGTAESTTLPGLAWLKILQGGLKVLLSMKNGVRTVGRHPPNPSPKPQNALPAGSSTNVPQPAKGGTLVDSQPSYHPPAPHNPASVQPGLRTSINMARRQLGLPPLSSAKTIGELHYKARNVRAHNEIMEWLDKNPNASWPEKTRVLNGIYERWRVSGLPGDG